MTAVPEIAYKEKVLDPMKHVGLVSNIDFFAERAGIDVHWLWKSALKALSANEVEYLRECRTLHEKHGLVGAFYAGAVDVTERMSLMTAALVRGFVDARLMSAQQLIDYTEAGQQPDATVLFCPNFFSALEFGKFSERRVAALSAVVYERAARGEQTVLHIDNLTEAKKRFGARFGSLVESHMLSFAGEHVGTV